MRFFVQCVNHGANWHQELAQSDILRAPIHRLVLQDELDSHILSKSSLSAQIDLFGFLKVVVLGISAFKCIQFDLGNHLLFLLLLSVVFVVILRLIRWFLTDLDPQSRL